MSTQPYILDQKGRKRMIDEYPPLSNDWQITGYIVRVKNHIADQLFAQLVMFDQTDVKALGFAYDLLFEFQVHRPWNFCACLAPECVKKRENWDKIMKEWVK